MSLLLIGAVALLASALTLFFGFGLGTLLLSDFRQGFEGQIKRGGIFVTLAREVV